MTRRILFALSLSPLSLFAFRKKGSGGASSGDPRPNMRAARLLPTDVAEMNAFANDYNEYIKSVNNGILSVKQWERVSQSWERLNGKEQRCK